MARTVVILQPSYLPWLGYFDQVRRANVFVLYDDVQFDKHGWRNRNRIKTASGPMWLTVPVLHTGRSRQRILDVEIERQTPWAKKHLSSISQNYARAPNTQQFLPELSQLLERDWKMLIDLNIAVIGLLAAWLGLDWHPVRSSELGVEGERTERLVKICQHFGATHYFSGHAARSYLDEELFRRAGIAVEFQDYAHPVYPQQHGEFISHLSALDLLLNCGERSRDILAGTDSPESKP